MILASPMAAPPPAAMRPSAPRAAATPASATGLGTCSEACACNPATRLPRISISRLPRRAPLPGVAITSARFKPSRAASSATRATAPGANTTRCPGRSWTKEVMSTDVRCDIQVHACAHAASLRPPRQLAAGYQNCKKVPRTLERSMRAGVLAPDSERFLRWAIGDREQHRFLSCPVGVMLPRRHHEHVVRAPIQHLAVDRGGALPFGADKNGAVGRAVFLALEALGEEREVRAHRRQYRPAVDRIGIAHARAMALVDVARLHHALDDRPRARVGVIDDGAAIERRRRAVGQHTRRVEAQRI